MKFSYVFLALFATMSAVPVSYSATLCETCIGACNVKVTDATSCIDNCRKSLNCDISNGANSAESHVVPMLGAAVVAVVYAMQ